jgi:hypothetical protein
MLTHACGKDKYHLHEEEREPLNSPEAHTNRNIRLESRVSKARNPQSSRERSLLNRLIFSKFWIACFALLLRGSRARSICEFRPPRSTPLENDLCSEFEHINKVTSKLVHSTAFSVLIKSDEGELDMMKPVLFRAGFRYAVEAFEKMQEYVHKNGVELPP